MVAASPFQTPLGAVVSGTEFFSTLFGSPLVGAEIHLASFRSILHPAWAGFRAPDTVLSATMPLLNNNYFCIARMKPGTFGRGLSDLAEHIMIVADDVGTKADADRLLALIGAPTFAIETSPGNQTWGWKLETGVKVGDVDRLRVLAAVRDKMKTDGLTDPGTADGVRYIRYFVGRNDKPAYGANGVPCRLMHWNAGRVVQLEWVARSLLGPDWEKIASSEQFQTMALAGQNGAVSSADMADEWVQLGLEIGLNPRRGAGPGKINADCPNMAAHTQRPESGFAFLGRGVVKCQHGECAHLTVRDMQNLMLEKYEQQVRDKVGAGEYVPNGLGQMVDKSGNVVPVSGTGFLAHALFEGAGSAGQAQESLVLEAAGVADRAEQHERAVEGAKQGLFSDLVYIHQTGTFYRVSTGEFFDDKRLDNLFAGLGLIPAGSSGKARATNQALNSKHVRKVDIVAYSPGEPLFCQAQNEGGVVVSALNRWRGGAFVWGGVASPVLGVPTEWLDLVEFVLPDQDYRDFWLDWWAWVLQNPSKRTSVIPLIMGGQGVGKNFMLVPLTEILGGSNVRTVSAGEMSGQFNDWLLKRLIVFEELRIPAGSTLPDRIKEWSSVSSLRVTVNEKFTRPYSVEPKYVFIAMSNHDNPVPDMETDDRRWAPYYSPAARAGVNVLPGERGTREYYKGLDSALHDPLKIAQIYDWLMRRNVSGFDHYNAPARVAAGHKANMMVASWTGAKQWMHEEMTSGAFVSRTVITTAELADAAFAGIANSSLRGGATPKAAGEALRSLGWERLGQIGGRHDRRPIWVKGDDVRAKVLALSAHERVALLDQEQRAQANKLASEAFVLGSVAS